MLLVRRSWLLAALGLVAWSTSAIAQEKPGEKNQKWEAKTYRYGDGPFTFFYGPGETVVWSDAGTIGLSLTPVGDLLRQHLGLPEHQGAVVRSVRPDSAAAKSGLKVGDILLKVGETPIKGVEDVNRLLQEAGEQGVDVELMREGKRMTVKVTPEAPRRSFFHEARHPQDGGSDYWIGVAVDQVDDTLRAQLKLPEGQGLVVTSVVDDSPAARAGLKTNDLLLKLSGEPLQSAAELIKKIEAAGEKPITFELLRAGKSLTAEIKPARRSGGRTFKFTGPEHQQDGGLFRRVYPGFTLPETPEQWQEWHKAQGSGGPASSDKVEKLLEDLLKETRAMHQELNALKDQMKR